MSQNDPKTTSLMLGMKIFL